MKGTTFEHCLNGLSTWYTPKHSTQEPSFGAKALCSSQIGLPRQIKKHIKTNRFRHDTNQQEVRPIGGFFAPRPQKAEKYLLCPKHKGHRTQLEPMGHSFVSAGLFSVSNNPKIPSNAHFFLSKLRGRRHEDCWNAGNRQVHGSKEQAIVVSLWLKSTKNHTKLSKGLLGS